MDQEDENPGQDTLLFRRGAIDRPLECFDEPGRRRGLGHDRLEAQCDDGGVRGLPDGPSAGDGARTSPSASAANCCRNQGY